MELEIDKFYEEERRDRSMSSPLNARTLSIALGLHLTAFAFFWIAAKIIYRAPDVVIPIDMTIVPPWAEQDPDDPDPDPNPPPEEPEKPEVKQPTKKVEKPKKEFKRGKVIKPPKVKPPVRLPPGKGTSRDKPLSQAEIMKALAAGARFGASNQLAASEEQRCVSLISRRFYECWTDFTWSPGLRPVVILVRFGNGGEIKGYRIIESSGDKKVDQSVLAAAKRAERVVGLSADFLRRYPEIPISMTPKGQ